MIDVASTSSTGSSTSGIGLSSVTGSLGLGSGSLSGGTNGGGVVNGGTVSLTYAGTISQTSNAPLLGVSGGDAGIDVLNISSGSFSFPSTASITNPTGEVVRITNSSPPFTYPGAFSKTSTGTGILVQSSGGSIAFSGSGRR